MPFELFNDGNAYRNVREAARRAPAVRRSQRARSSALAPVVVVVVRRCRCWSQCTTSNEDPTCIDHYALLNPLDHALYMQIDILQGIPFGCLYTDPMKKR